MTDGSTSIETAVVWGTGSIGSQHLKALIAMGVPRVIAVPATPGRTTPRDLGGAELADTLPSGADVLVIATDTKRHVADTLRALDTEPRALLLEKPAAVQADDVEPLLRHRLADRARVAAPLRMAEGLGRAREWLGRLQRPFAIDIRCQSWLPAWRPTRDYRDAYSARPDEGGVLRDLIHEIDYLIWLFGAPTSIGGGVSPVPSPVLGLEVEESADLTLGWPDGSAATVRLDYVTNPGRRGLLVTSQAGAVEWDALASRSTFRSADGEIEVGEFLDDRDRHLALQRQFRSMVGEEGSAPLPSLADGMLALRICDAAREQSLTALAPVGGTDGHH